MPHGIKGWGIFILAQTALTFAWHMVEKLAEHAMLTWSDDQIATFFGLSSQSASAVISWAIPAFLGFVTLLAYHAVQPYISPSHLNVSAMYRPTRIRARLVRLSKSSLGTAKNTREQNRFLRPAYSGDLYISLCSIKAWMIFQTVTLGLLLQRPDQRRAII
jgi:hypothetical protein